MKAEEKAQNSEKYSLYRDYHTDDHGGSLGKRYDQRKEQSGSDGFVQPESAGSDGE